MPSRRVPEPIVAVSTFGSAAPWAATRSPCGTADRGDVFGFASAMGDTSHPEPVELGSRMTRILERAFRRLAAVRGGRRAVHPIGRTFHATVSTLGGHSYG